MRVVVVQHEASGRIIKVCEDKQTAKTWVGHSEWNSYDVMYRDCNVTEWEDLT